MYLSVLLISEDCNSWALKQFIAYRIQFGRIEKKHFFVNSEILGRHIWQKKQVNYNKFEIATNSKNQIFNLKELCFFLLTGAT